MEYNVCYLDLIKIHFFCNMGGGNFCSCKAIQIFGHDSLLLPRLTQRLISITKMLPSSFFFQKYDTFRYIHTRSWLIRVKFVWQSSYIACARCAHAVQWNSHFEENFVIFI